MILGFLKGAATINPQLKNPRSLHYQGLDTEQKQAEEFHEIHGGVFILPLFT